MLIQKCNRVILILDALEEKRNLFTTEFNFKNIVKQHLEDLLLIECNYWRNRCTVRWIQMSEDNSNFFSCYGFSKNEEKCYFNVEST
jgi:hypothetical protein